jgi:hypothetical protein
MNTYVALVDDELGVVPITKLLTSTDFIPN